MPKSAVLTQAISQPPRHPIRATSSPLIEVAAIQPAPSLSSQQLASFVRQLVHDRRSWADLVEHHPERWWTRLVGTDSLDAWLITWPRDLATELHDHGDSWAAFAVVGGALTEHTALPSGRRSTRTLRPGPLGVVPPGGVHDVVNADPTPAVSVHAYSPPLRSMTYYSQSGGLLRPTRTRTPESTNGWAP